MRARLRRARGIELTLRNHSGPRRALCIQELDKLYGWLKREVWPLWLERGIDWKHAGFHEHLDHQTLRCGADFRRLRVVSRQVFSFTEAALHGISGASQAVQVGVDFLVAARQSDGGFPRRFDLHGRPIEQTRDLYDHAFVLLAFSNAARLLGSASLQAEALATLRFIDQHLRHPNGGFFESMPVTMPRRQNPHMHLLEAALAAFATFGDPVFADLAQELLALFLRRLFQIEAGSLPEFFHEDLSPLLEEGRFRIEPGHHYEWVWLLDRCASTLINTEPIARRSIATVSTALLRFADSYGVAKQWNLVVDELDSGGQMKRPTFRLWPQTERMKCEARRGVGDDATAAAAIASLWQMIAGAPTGLWHERLDASGNPSGASAPASSLYHLTCAITDARDHLA